jgi:DNA-binding MarR family transcriptional regulator
MTAEERRARIRTQLHESGSVQVADLAAQLQVSKMTIHRDLLQFEEAGEVRRVHGGAVMLAKATAERVKELVPQAAAGECLICHRPPTQHLLYTMTTSNGEQRQACCPHCGISAHLLYGSQIIMALTADYLSGRLHAAQNSWFLLGSVAAPCCHPSILTFDDEQMARRFQAGFGGSVGSLNDAIRFLREAMTLDPSREGCPHCAAAQGAKS